MSLESPVRYKFTKIAPFITNMRPFIFSFLLSGWLVLLRWVPSFIWSCLKIRSTRSFFIIHFLGLVTSQSAILIWAFLGLFTSESAILHEPTNQCSQVLSFCSCWIWFRRQSVDYQSLGWSTYEQKYEKPYSDIGEFHLFCSHISMARLNHRRYWLLQKYFKNGRHFMGSYAIFRSGYEDLLLSVTVRVKFSVIWLGKIPIRVMGSNTNIE